MQVFSFLCHSFRVCYNKEMPEVNKSVTSGTLSFLYHYHFISFHFISTALPIHPLGIWMCTRLQIVAAISVI